MALEIPGIEPDILFGDDFAPVAVFFKQIGSGRSSEKAGPEAARQSPPGGSSIMRPVGKRQQAFKSQSGPVPEIVRYFMGDIYLLIMIWGLKDSYAIRSPPSAHRSGRR
jgi:hypothetical protein